MRLRLASALACVLLVWPLTAFGTPQVATSLQNPEPLQDPEAAAPAHVAYVEGAVVLERDGRPETAPLNMPLLTGDRLKTLEGRVEVLFADGSALHLDARSTIDLQSDELVRLIDGRLRLNIAADGAARSARLLYRVDSPAGSVRITQAGEYRLAILRRGEETQLELAVLRGGAEIFTDEGSTPLGAGERAYASAGLAPSYAYAYNSANWDAFDRWSEARRDTRAGASAQYLPSEVRAYASTFDEEGDWRYQQSYGYVWYPRVAVSWRPYYYGRWARYPRFGWTWIGADRFAWPTHHYGRWGFSAGAWFWIPARRWAPAYVSWAYAPGYVSWCPLGFDNRPVIAINIFNVGPGYYSSGRAWTAVGYNYFGRDYVHRRAVDWDRFDRTGRPSFQIARSAPAYRDIAVPRASGAATAQGAPIRSAGNRAVPRYINRGDDIVRSETGRPSAPQRPDANSAVPRGSAGAQGIPSREEPGPSRLEGSVPSRAERRAAPAGPARRIETPAAPELAPDVPRSRGMRDGVRPYTPPAYDRGGVPRSDNPAYVPPSRTYEPYAGGRAVPPAAPPQTAAPSRESAPPAAPEMAPRGYARPRGAFDSPPPPPAAASPGPRQPPAPRAMPAPERSAPSGDRAVPRGSGAARPGPSAPPPAAGMPSGARSRGRGGAQ
ncbi:MAG TPA: DUF6600 domain-containing protein [Vicinamibacterales bacterium]|nr:DUF6600 domain-containing protein [Vicinamibacterales bacterium]